MNNGGYMMIDFGGFNIGGDPVTIAGIFAKCKAAIAAKKPVIVSGIQRGSGSSAITFTPCNATLTEFAYDSTEYVCASITYNDTEQTISGMITITDNDEVSAG